MIGKRAFAKERLDPSGYILVHGELWKAEIVEGSPPIEEGEAVRVEGIRGRILLVRKESNGSDKG